MTARPQKRRLALNAELREPTAVTEDDGAQRGEPSRTPARPAAPRQVAPGRPPVAANNRRASTDANGATAPRAETPTAARTPQPAGRRGRQVWARIAVDQWERLTALKAGTSGAVTPASLLGELVDRHLPDDAGEVVALVREYDRGLAEPPTTAEHVFRLAQATDARLARAEAAMKRELDWATRGDLLGALIDRFAPTSAAEAQQRIRHHERVRRHGSQAATPMPSDAPNRTASSSPTLFERS